MLAVLSANASAQVLTFGVQGGVPAQTPRGRTDAVPFVLGPSVGIRISSGLSLETGLLYRRIGRGVETALFAFPENSVTARFETWRGNAVEVPLLAKYRFLSDRSGWRPFLTAGPALRRTSITSNVGTYPNPTDAGRILVGQSKNIQWKIDPSFGTGVDLRTGRFHIEPEVRYSYWGAGKTTSIRKNQVNFMLGFRF